MNSTSRQPADHVDDQEVGDASLEQTADQEEALQGEVIEANTHPRNQKGWCPNPDGRPEILIDADFLKKCEGIAITQLTQRDIALAIGMAESTFYNKMTKYPEIKEAIARGKARGLAKVANTLHRKAVEGNVDACKFILKCHGGFIETSQVNVQGAIPIFISKDDAEL